MGGKARCGRSGPSCTQPTFIRRGSGFPGPSHHGLRMRGAGEALPGAALGRKRAGVCGQVCSAGQAGDLHCARRVRSQRPAVCRQQRLLARRRQGPLAPAVGRARAEKTHGAVRRRLVQVRPGCSPFVPPLAPASRSSFQPSSPKLAAGGQLLHCQGWCRARCCTLRLASGYAR